MRVISTVIVLALGAASALATGSDPKAGDLSRLWLLRDGHGFTVNAQDLYDRLVNLPRKYAQIPLSDPKRYSRFVEKVFLQRRLAVQGEAWLRKHDPHHARFKAAQVVLAKGTRREKDEYFSTFFLDRMVERSSADFNTQAREYFQAHPQEFFLPAGRKFAGIAVNPAPGSAKSRHQFFPGSRESANMIADVARRQGFAEALHYCSELSLSGTQLECHKIAFDTNDPVVAGFLRQLLMKVKQRDIIGDPLPGKSGWLIVKWVGSMPGHAPKFNQVAPRIIKLLSRDYKTNLRLEASQRYQSFTGYETSSENITAALDALRKAIQQWPGEYSPEYLARHPKSGVKTTETPLATP